MVQIENPHIRNVVLIINRNNIISLPFSLQRNQITLRPQYALLVCPLQPSPAQAIHAATYATVRRSVRVCVPPLPARQQAQRQHEFARATLAPQVAGLCVRVGR